MWAASLLLLVFVIFISQNIYYTHALFEEQAGEFDWTIENVGLIQHSVRLSTPNTGLIVVTKEGVLAKIDWNSGIASWRNVLSSQSKATVKLISAGHSIVTLSEFASPITAKDTRSTASSYVVTSYSVGSGQMEWETMLSVDAEVAGVEGLMKEIGTIHDLHYNPQFQRIEALAGNCVSFIARGTGVLQGPSYCGSQANVDGSETDKLFLITQLSLPMTSDNAAGAGSSKSEIQRLGAGCLINRNSVSECNRVGVVQSTTSTGDVSLNRVLLKLIGEQFVVSPRSLKGSLVRSGSLSAQDTLIGLFSNAEHHITAKAFTIVTGQITESELTLSESVNDYAAVNVMLTSEEDLAVLVAITHARTELASEFSEVLQFSNGAFTSTRICPGASIVLPETHSDFSTLTTALSCVSTPSASSDSVYLTRVTVGPAQRIDVQSELALVSEKGLVSASSLVRGSDVQFIVSTRDSSAQKGKAPVATNIQGRTLIVSRTGMTISFNVIKQAKAPHENIAVAKWVRDESLGRVQASLVYEQALHDVVDAVQDSDLEAVMPDFATRLALQREELTEWGISILHTMQSLPQQIRVAVQQFIPGLAPADDVDAPLEGLGMTVGGPSTTKTKASVRAAERRRGRLAQQQTAINRVVLNSAPSSATGGHEENHLQRLHARKFGFNKVSVMVSASTSDLMLETQRQASSEFSPVSFLNAGLRVLGVDLVTGVPLWSVEPVLSGSVSSSSIVWVHLLTGHSPVASETTTSGPYATLLVLLQSGDLLSWHIDPTTGNAVGATCDKSTSSSYIARREPSLVLPNMGDVNQIDAFSSSSTAQTPVNWHDESSVTHGQYLLIHGRRVQPEAPLRVTLYPPRALHQVQASTRKHFTHTIDVQQGSLQTYSIDFASCASVSSSSSTTCHAKPIASAAFPADSEAIVDVSYPSAHDVLDKRFNVLGDDSVLLKYVNHHVALVTTVSPPEAAVNSRICEGSSASSTGSASGDGAGETDTAKDSAKDVTECRLYVTLIDTVSAKVIYRVQHEGGAAPVHSTIVENMLVYSYWNAKAKRTELSTAALFEGMVDRYGLTPFASTASANHAATIQKDSQFSSFTANSPLGAQRTYILPRAVTAITHTTSAFGIANKNIIVAMAPGQLYSIDMRMIHPRRPMQEPSLPEKEEGLTQYQPYVPLTPVQSISLDQVLGAGVRAIGTSATHLESTTLVLAHGGLDVFFNRVQSSGGFDLLASDFNYSLLVAILSGLSLAAFVLRRLYFRSKLATAWQ